MPATAAARLFTTTMKTDAEAIAAAKTNEGAGSTKNKEDSGEDNNPNMGVCCCWQVAGGVAHVESHVPQL